MENAEAIDETSDELSSQKKVAIDILGNDDYQGLCEWFELNLKCKAQYVVYMVRRSYLVALLFETLTGKKMKDSKKKLYVTDTAFLSCCDDLVKFYKMNECFPSVVLCDDLLIHGRSLNRMLENVEEYLCENLGEYERDEIIASFCASVKIHIYCRAEDSKLLLKSRYRRAVVSTVTYPAGRRRQLSSRISTLVFKLGMTNTTFVNSEIVKDTRIADKWLEGHGYKKNRYQGIENYTKSRFLIDDENNIYAIYTGRFIRGSRNQRYKFIPCVILPNLSAEETNDLYQEIKKKASEKAGGEKLFELLDHFYTVKGLRTFNEWLMLILGQAVIYEVKNLYDIFEDDKAATTDFDKLKRNYRLDSSKKHINCLKYVLGNNPIFESTHELDEILLKVCKKRPMGQFGQRHLETHEIEAKLEDYFYAKGYADEEEALEYNGNPLMQHGVMKQSVRGCVFLFKELLDHVTYDVAEHYVDWFLVMSDAGDLSLSPLGATGIKVVGFALYAKAGEQALLIAPLRYMEYISFLSLVETWTEQIKTDYWKHLENYANSSYCDIDSKKMDMLKDFIRRINKIGQNASEWDGRYWDKVDYRNITPESLEEKRQSHIKHYLDYLKAES